MSFAFFKQLLLAISARAQDLPTWTSEVLEKICSSTCVFKSTLFVKQLNGMVLPTPLHPQTVNNGQVSLKHCEESLPWVEGNYIILIARESEPIQVSTYIGGIGEKSRQKCSDNLTLDIVRPWKEQSSTFPALAHRDYTGYSPSLAVLGREL